MAKIHPLWRSHFNCWVGNEEEFEETDTNKISCFQRIKIKWHGFAWPIKLFDGPPKVGCKFLNLTIGHGLPPITHLDVLVRLSWKKDCGGADLVDVLDGYHGHFPRGLQTSPSNGLNLGLFYDIVMPFGRLFNLRTVVLCVNRRVREGYEEGILYSDEIDLETDILLDSSESASQAAILYVQANDPEESRGKENNKPGSRLEIARKDRDMPAELEWGEPYHFPRGGGLTSGRPDYGMR